MKKRLNIIFLDFDDIKNPLLGAGQARATLEVGKRLSKKGHKVTVICSRYPGYKDRKENGIFYKHISIGTPNIRLNNFLYIILLPFTVMRLKADVIVECFTAPVSTLFSPLFTKVPVVAIPTSFEAERFSKLYKFPFVKIQNFGLKFYKYFMPYTKALEQKMKAKNNNVISKIVPEGVGEEYFEVKRKKSEHILFLGRFDMGQKGIDLLLKSYALSAEKIKLPLVIAGLGPDEEKIKKLAKTLGIEERVKFVGPVFGKKKMELLSKSLFVAFSSRHEGFSLFSLEALASGLPLVGFDIPSLEYVSDNASYKAKPFSVSDYSKLLLKASQNKDIKKMSANARKIAKKYSWENVANEFESFFVNTMLNKI